MTSAAVLSDADLVNDTLAGNREAFSHIVSRYQSLICSLAYSATGSLAQSEDLAQETFITAWKHLSLLREPDKLRSWLCGVARNRINNYLRREGRKPLHDAESLETVQHLQTSEALPVEKAISEEEQALLWRALEQIPQLYREPLVLYYREHQSIESVAADLDLTEDAVKQRLSRGRRLLQENVVSFVEGALERTRPGKAFTAAVLTALPLFAGSASAATVGATAAKGASAAKAAFSTGLAGAILGPIVGIAGGAIGTKLSIENTKSLRERRFMVRLAWVTWIFVAVFGGLVFGFTLVARHYSKAHPAAIAVIFVGLALMYSVILVTLVLWSNRRQRQIRIEEDLKAPGGLPVAAAGFEPRPFEYRSRRTFLGLPLVHITMRSQLEGKMVPARGWIAIGTLAYGGLFACGAFAVAPISVGGVALGLVAVGGMALGALSFAGLASGIVAMGGAAVGYVAHAGGAVAWLAAQGGLALAHDFALGGLAVAEHANDEAARLFFQNNGFSAQMINVMRHTTCLVWLPVVFVFWELMLLRRAPKN